MIRKPVKLLIVIWLCGGVSLLGGESTDQSSHRPASGAANGAAATQEELKSSFLLVDLKNRKLRKTSAEEVLPQRIYLRWEKDYDRSAIPSERGSWVLDVSGNGSSFHPGDVLLPGSIVPGEWLGEEPGTRWVYRENVKSNFDRWVQLQGKPVAEFYVSSYPENDDGTERTKRVVGTYVFGLKLVR